MIVNVVGIRREESPGRAKAPISKPHVVSGATKYGTAGLTWHPLLEWTKRDVLDLHNTARFPLHEAYTRYGSSRVSCAYCILSSKADLLAAATCISNHDLYRAMVQLEIASAFSFQDSAWLGDMQGQQQRSLIAAPRVRVTPGPFVQPHFVFE